MTRKLLPPIQQWLPIHASANRWANREERIRYVSMGYTRIGFLAPWNALVKLINVKMYIFSGLRIWWEKDASEFKLIILIVSNHHLHLEKLKTEGEKKRSWTWLEIFFAFLGVFNWTDFISLHRASQFRSVTPFSISKIPVHVSSLLWRSCFALTGGISNVFLTGE